MTRARSVPVIVTAFLAVGAFLVGSGVWLPCATATAPVRGSLIRLRDDLGAVKAALAQAIQQVEANESAGQGSLRVFGREVRALGDLGARKLRVARGVPHVLGFRIRSRPGAPVNTGEPVVTGAVANGQVLSTSRGRWAHKPTSFSYQWQDCAKDGTRCVNIDGARSRSYTVHADDAGHTIRALVTATNPAGSRSARAPIVPLIDNFTRDRRIDHNIWYAPDQQGDTSNGEVECYRPSQVRLSHRGGLEETIRYVPSGFNCPPGTRNSANPLYYASGAVQMRSVSFTYGTVVARMKMSGAGTWPALWLLGASCQTPNWLTDGPNSTGFACAWSADTADAAEIDVAEHDTNSDKMLENVYNSSSGVSRACIDNVGKDVTAGYHTYELDWSPGSLVFKVDGAVTDCGLSGDGVPSHPMFLIINTASCTVSACGATPDNSTLPQTTSIRYVHISH